MEYIAKLAPNKVEILAKQEKRDTAKKYGWNFMDRNIPGETGTFLKGKEVVWQSDSSFNYVRADKTNQGYKNLKYFATLEEALK